MADPTSGPEDPGSQEDAGDPASSAGVASAPGEAHEGPGGEAGPQEEARRKFREALERKRARETGAGSEGRGKDGGKIHGSHGPAYGRRTFRRKSGG
jgi:uncharacterized protein DUF5302